ncbi:MAG: hypothetical protein K5912_03055 [Alphaproteobacteria bacterium]|nr:hypothetical protein [Alphaproteobacteria bacterium]
MNILENRQTKNTMSETEKRIVRIITKTKSLEGLEVGGFSRLVDDLHIDSLESYEIFMNFESEFGVEIPKFMSKNVTIKYLGEYIDNSLKKIAAKQAQLNEKQQ